MTFLSFIKYIDNIKLVSKFRMIIFTGITLNSH